MIGLAPKKKTQVAPADTASLNATPIPSWMSGEAPSYKPRKKPRIDSGGQLARGSMRAA
jgi:hypothetical protein